MKIPRRIAAVLYILEGTRYEELLPAKIDELMGGANNSIYGHGSWLV
jgi:hypothetical protein